MLCLALALALCITAAAAARTPDAEMPSFLFVLGDDIGWADFHYNNGTALSPRIDAWTKEPGTIIMHDFHSGGTVCSPTRASVLTGRTPFRDCVFGVYGCSDPTECTPNFPFAPKRTFTIGDAVRAADAGYFSMHFGKWHLGSFYNDSATNGAGGTVGFASSPVTHGFDDFNSTIEVAPTQTTNCQCNEKWYKSCDFGAYKKPTHCSRMAPGTNPGGGAPLKPGCCFNYWWRDDTKEHAIANLTWPTIPDDAEYLADSDVAGHKPFLAQISFHNCHIPFIGGNKTRRACQSGKSCAAEASQPGLGHPGNFSDTQLDYYACLNEFDSAMGKVLDVLDKHKYRQNTMIFFTTDNGPEVNCNNGLCAPSHFLVGPGNAGPLRGRKRDTWEGGHRVPGIIAWPAMVGSKQPRVSWDTAITSDFLPTIMDVLALHGHAVQRPAAQTGWAVDGISLLPVIKGGGAPVARRCIGHLYANGNNKGYRCGKWKLVNGSKSCAPPQIAGCGDTPGLYNLETDLGERHDLSASEPAVLASMMANLTNWYESVLHSEIHESVCPNANGGGGFWPGGGKVVPGNSSECNWAPNAQLGGGKVLTVKKATKSECCGACRNTAGCQAAHWGALPSAAGSSTDDGGDDTVAQCNLRTNAVWRNGTGSVCIACGAGPRRPYSGKRPPCKNE